MSSVPWWFLRQMMQKGGGTDPNAVQKTGDTMTGQLVITGAEGLSTTGHVRLTGRGNILQIDTNISFVTIDSNGALGWNLSWNGMGSPKIFPDTSQGGEIRLACSTANHGIQITDAVTVNALRPNASGDLVITQITGPNAGKSVNLTAGKWV